MFFEFIRPTSAELPWSAFQALRDSLDHMEVSGSRARRRHRSSQFVNRLSAIQPHALTTPDGVSLPLTIDTEHKKKKLLEAYAEELSVKRLEWSNIQVSVVAGAGFEPAAFRL
jgi:hypothetical protein